MPAVLMMPKAEAVAATCYQDALHNDMTASASCAGASAISDVAALLHILFTERFTWSHGSCVGERSAALLHRRSHMLPK